MAACVFLAALFNEKVEGVNAVPAELGKDDADVIQKFVGKHFGRSK